MMFSPLNTTTFASEPRDRTPEIDPDSVEALESHAASLSYPETCRGFRQMRAQCPKRPSDLASSPVLQAWMAVLAIEAHLLEFARARRIGERAAYRYFVRQRGSGIPRRPAWRIAVARARRAG